MKKAAGIAAGLVGLVGAGVAYSLWKADSEEIESGQTVKSRVLHQQNRIIERYEARDDRLEAIQDKALARMLGSESFGFMYEALNALALPVGPNYGNEYTHSRFARLNDYASVEALTDIYLANHAVSFSSSFNDECFAAQEPFDYPFVHRWEWQEVVFDNGEVANLSDITSGSFNPQKGSYCIEDYPIDHEVEPAALRGEFVTPLPSDILEVEFTTEDIGSTKRVSGIAVTLVSMGEYFYEIDVNDAQSNALPLRDYQIVGEAIADNGRYVVRNNIRDEPLAYYLEFEPLLDELIDRLEAGKLDEEQVRREIMAYKDKWTQEKEVHYKAFGFSAPVETAKITLLSRRDDAVDLNRSISAPVFSQQAFASDELLASSRLYFDRPVYDDRYILQGEHSDYTSNELPSLIDIRKEQTRPEYRQDNEYSDKVYFDYPAVASDLFIDTLERYQNPADGDVRFFDADDNLVDVPTDDERLYRFMVSRVEYNPDLFSEYPVRLEVRLPVRTAPDVTKRRFALDGLPEGIDIEGNTLVIDHSVFSFESVGLENDVTSLFFVTGKEQGRYLKEVTSTSLYTDSGAVKDTHYFYGLPESVEIWQPGEISVIELTMETELPESIEEQEHVLLAAP